MTSRCDFCGLLAEVTLHPLRYHMFICKPCKFQEARYRKQELANMLVSKKHVAGNSSTKQLESLDQVEKYFVKLVKQMTYQKLVDRLKFSNETKRFDYQEAMV